MPRYGMVIDLQRCVGCGACALACKTENNTRDRKNGQTFNWADFIVELDGVFPDANFTTIPVLCNHCSKAPCVEECPTEPKAMYKTADGITMHNDDRCIGCQACQEACPYSALDVDDEGVPYSVISYNDDEGPAYPEWADRRELIANGTASGAEVTRLAQQVPAHRNMYRHPDYGSVRRGNVTEKCILCHHRVVAGLLPACVEACPSEARIFGDLEDAGSAPSRALKEHASTRLKEEAGTEPNVYYIRKFSVRE